MNLRYTRRALAHLAEIRAYIEQDRPAAAASVGASIRDAVSRLTQFPDIGRPGRVDGTRELVVPRLPFIVVYRVTGSHVDVLAILHAARRWPAGPAAAPGRAATRSST